MVSLLIYSCNRNFCSSFLNFIGHVLQLFKRPRLHRLHAYLHAMEQVFQLLCDISVVKRSNFFYGAKFTLSS